MEKKQIIYCIIPAYNEEGNLAEVIRALKQHVDRIVVIDDGSNDATAIIAKQQGVTSLRHIINRGQGAALETGTIFALNNKADIIVHFDADGQFLAKEIQYLVKPIQNKDADVVFGSRFMGIHSDMPFFKKQIIMPIARTINSLIMGIHLTDPQSGFRVMNRKAAKIIRIKNDGAAHCSEILIKVFKSDLKIKEVPITVVYKGFGQGIFNGRGRGQGGLRILKDIFIAKLLD